MIAIVKYNAGNTRSVTNALRRLGAEPVLTDVPSELQQADKIIFPGVGEASTAMHHLRAKGLDQVIKNLHQPFLGICLGMQLMCRHSEENDTQCLGIFDQAVKRFPPIGKVPHMGWNELHQMKSPLFDKVAEGRDVYFVHSYYAELTDHTIATCDYLKPFGAAIAKNNFYGVQFHPEKSGKVGEQILQNFLDL